MTNTIEETETSLTFQQACELARNEPVCHMHGKPIEGIIITDGEYWAVVQPDFSDWNLMPDFIAGRHDTVAFATRLNDMYQKGMMVGELRQQYRFRDLLGLDVKSNIKGVEETIRKLLQIDD